MNQKNDISILLVEDDESHADLIKWTLEKVGVENALYHVRNGQKAIDFLMQEGDYADNDPSLTENLIMLLDINMPVMDGHEVLEYVRSHEKTKNLPVIMLTTAGNNQTVEKCYALGCNMFLKKSIDHDQFVNTIRQLAAILPTLRVPMMVSDDVSDKKILYIEDEESQIALVDHYLNRGDYGISVDFASTGEEGIAAFNAEEYDLVIIDYNLPDADAPEIAEAILDKGPECPPIAFLSNVFTSDRIAKAEDMGIIACLQKRNPKKTLLEITGLLQ